jgi:hypothetical protein
MKKTPHLLPLAMLLLAGCQTPRQLYYWGNYETILYQTYSKADKAGPAEQVAKLEEDLALAAGKEPKSKSGSKGGLLAGGLLSSERIEAAMNRRAAGKNLPPNPGLHAQLGLAYYQLGKIEEAKREFATEKALFPESGVFVDRMLAKLKTTPTP